MLKTYLKRPKLSESLQRRSHSLAYPMKPHYDSKSKPHNQDLNFKVQPSVTITKHYNKDKKGLTPKFIESRRQNFLNTGYNNRKQKLKSITTENKGIYQRINKQKSSYSRAQMNKSYESSCNISRRLSQSKISNRSNSSRSSLRSSQSRKSTSRNQNPFLKPRTTKKYQIEAQDISTLKKEQIDKIGAIFKTATNENAKPYSSNKRRSNYSTKNSHNRGDKKSLKTVLPPIPNSNSLYRDPLSSKNDGAFLHKIAEEMYRHKK